MKLQINLILIGLFIALQIGCNTVNTDVKVTPVDTSLFIESNLLEEITTEDCELSNGLKTKCYKITMKAKPQEHKTGPFCPETIKDDKEKGGIWFKDGKIYDIDGEFVANLDEFYNNPEWKLYREDGTVRISDTKAQCTEVAQPVVNPKYKNYCVECLASYFEEKKTTYRIPVTPVYMNRTSSFDRGQALGLAFNGVQFDPPAPLELIKEAYTIGPLDDCGGHVNPFEGYHYHAATGCSKEVPNKDGHSPMLGYALDGFGIYARLDKDGKEPENLDECGGHIDENIGYHYHIGKPGDNEIIGCFRGQTGSSEVSE